VTTLPSSFHDGISGCRRLHIKYLWIDSLCIFQSVDGSDKDWLHHATEMELIYMNCALNLTIVHASSSHDGTFVERNPDFWQDCYSWSLPSQRVMLCIFYASISVFHSKERIVNSKILMFDDFDNRRGFCQRLPFYLFPWFPIKVPKPLSSNRECIFHAFLQLRDDMGPLFDGPRIVPIQQP
ncbi:hypothetical protein B0J14DRAFT_477278, partial [Halenospora varia]